MRLLNLGIWTLVVFITGNFTLNAIAQPVAEEFMIIPDYKFPPPPLDNSNYIVPITQVPQKQIGVIITPENPLKPQFLGYIGTNLGKLIKLTPNNDLVVMAMDIRVFGVSKELEEIALKAISTHLGGDTSQSQLQKDVDAILATGFFTQAQVTSTPTAMGLRIVYQLKPIIVRSLQLKGAEVLLPSVAQEFFKSQLEKTVNPSALQQGMEQLQQWYKQNGYVLAQVLSIRPSREEIVTIEVAEGKVGEVKIRFLDKDAKPTKGRTQESFLLRELQLQSGQIFRADVAQKDIQRLYKLGLFDKAEVSLNGDARKVDVTYELREHPARAINGGIGYNDDVGLFGLISYSDQNFNGINQQLGGNLQLSPRDVQFDGKFTSPYRASNPNRLGYSINIFRRRGLSPTFDDNILLANGDKVREGRFGGGIKLIHPIYDWDASIGLNYLRTSLRDRNGNITKIDAQSNPLSFSGTGIDDLVTLSAAITKDRRDNVINPTKGSIINFSSEQSIPIGLGNILMNRIQANYSQYFPVSIIGSKHPEVLAFNVQAGTTWGDLPPYQAVNLGGANSVRGYTAGSVASARSFILATAEYRFPIFSMMGGVVFADLGSDLGSSDTVLGEPGVVRGKPGTGFGYGAGVRVQSPFGVIRGDFGFNDQGSSRLQFGIGQRF